MSLSRLDVLLEDLRTIVEADGGDAAFRAALRDVRQDKTDLAAWQRLLAAAHRAGKVVTAWTGNARMMRKIVTQIHHGPRIGGEAAGHGYVCGFLVLDTERKSEVGIHPERITRVEVEDPPVTPKGGPK